MGVALFRDQAPRSFGLFDRALSSMFRLTAGETWLDELVLLDPDQGGSGLPPRFVNAPNS
jgi:hypothetical protein